jgi:histone acetyltransferase (RNA polymerase elongator complex component)
LSNDAIGTQLHLAKHYIEDPIFDPDEGMIGVLSGRSYTVECRVDIISDGWIDRAKKAGVTRVKLGVESGSKDFINHVNKKIDLDMVEGVVKRLKAEGIAVHIYSMLGWDGVTEAEYWEGLDFLKKLDADYYVINLTCIYGRGGRDWRFDTHFSPIVARYWGLSDALVFAYFSLQEGKVNPTLL